MPKKKSLLETNEYLRDPRTRCPHTPSRSRQNRPVAPQLIPVPPALALGPGAETRRPMAIAVIGGVVFSTLLTLFVVPCAYQLLSRLERKRYDSVAAADLPLFPELSPGHVHTN